MPLISRRRFLAASGASAAGALAAGGLTWRTLDQHAQASDTVTDAVSVTTTRYRTLPGTAVPDVSVVDTAGRPTDIGRRLFAGSNTTTSGLLIADGTGSPVWWKSMPDGTNLQNFHVDTFRGEPVLVYYTGTLDVELGAGRGVWHVLDTAYEEIATISAGNGYHADLHDLLLRDDGTAVLECYPTVKADLSAQGGSSSASVLESVIQRVDVSTGDVMSEWHSLDHIPVTETYQDLDTDEVDYMHVNTLAAVPGDDNAVLVSARHLSQVFRLDLDSGAIGWRLGGRRATVRLTGRQTAPLRVDGTALPFSYQHDAQLTAAGELTVFDNGNQRDPGFSRSVTYRLDADRTTATEVIGATLTHEPAVYASSQGNVQRLSTGRSLVSWGGLGHATVFTDRQVTAEITGVPTYRLFLQDWVGRPSAAPSAVVTSTGVLASWNGSTETRMWRVVDGENPSRVLATVPRTGFETSVPVSLAGGARIEVLALDANGTTLARTRVLTVD